MFFSPCKLFTAVTPLTCCKQHLKNQSNFVHCGLTKIIFTYQMFIHRQILIFVTQIDTPISQIKRWFWDSDFFFVGCIYFLYTFKNYSLRSMYKQSINSEWTIDKNTLLNQGRWENCKKIFLCYLLYQTLSKEVLYFLLVFIVLQCNINRIFHY